MPETSEENRTIPQLFWDRAALFKDRTALLYKDKPSAKFLPIAWSDWADKVRQTALGLFSLGIRRYDRVALLSENRPEWTFIDLAVLSLGAVVVPIYPTSSTNDVEYILKNSEAQGLVVSNQEHFNRLLPVIEKNKQLKWIVCFDTVKSSARILRIDDVMAKGSAESAVSGVSYDRFVAVGDPDDLATIIYTSGTTGPPKGVMLTHRNFVSNYLGAKERIKLSTADLALSFLPLSHVFERLAGYYFMIFHGAAIAYAENMQTVAEDIQIIRPTVCAAVPRFYEKVYSKIMEKVEAETPLKKKIFRWAVEVGRHRSELIFQHSPVPFFLSLQFLLARIIVFNKIKRKMGGRIRFFISGGAPLAKDLAQFFYAADVLILEGYGLTETSPVIAVNAEDDFRFGTVGRPLRNVEVRIADDGEIITRGPCVMKGYFRNEEATQEALQGGWFHTGDIGVFENGFLKITDRKKDIIATSGGKKVAPQNIEGKILSDPLFLQAVVLGDKKNYLVALIVPNRTQVEKYAESHGLKLAYSQLLKSPEIVSWIDARFRSLTAGLASYEQIKYYELLEREFTQDAGELTPTLKCKRRFIMEKYKDIIDALYQLKPDVHPSGS